MATDISRCTFRHGDASAPERTIKALVNGAWHDALAETADVRQTLANGGSGFRHRVSAAEGAEFPAEAGRYHLYVSYACPWAHRTIIYRKLKRLEDAISMSVLHPRWAGPGGWCFADTPMSTVDHTGGRRYLYEVYQAAEPDYTGRVTVPVLWDRKKQTIVNNQSSEIIRMLNSAFDAWGDPSVDFYPAPLRKDIDALNAWLIPNVCAGVYKAGFAANQAAYDEAVQTLFESLDEVEKRVARQPYLLGRRITESDWHLFTTLCRFDAVYHGALKCNLRRLIDYPALCAYTRRLHRVAGVAKTVRVEHIKHHYHDGIGEIDPTIVPRGPAIDYADLAEDRFLQEVLELHAYLEDWLKGTVPDQERGPARLEQALADDFFVIHPNGTRETKADVVRNFASAYGTKSGDYALEISDASVRPLSGGLSLVTYRETHRGEPGRTRTSSALLRRCGENIEWGFLQETSVSDTQA